jgi:hypothetical protein
VGIGMDVQEVEDGIREKQDRMILRNKIADARKENRVENKGVTERARVLNFQTANWKSRVLVHKNYNVHIILSLLQ